MSKIEVGNDNGQFRHPEVKTPPAFMPGMTIGILGSGQLGRMTAMAAKSLGYRVVVFDEASDGPAASCADLSIAASFDDEKELDRFATEVDVVTIEFENIPVSTLEFLEKKRHVHPSPSVVRTCQDRVLEKKFLLSNGFPLAPFRVINSAEDLAEGLKELDAPSILKTAALGYDGKGQMSIAPGEDARAAWVKLASPRAVLEKRIPFISEASVICARTAQGETICFPVQENEHVNGILDVTIAPAPIDFGVAAEAQRIASAIAERIELTGLITVEFFLLSDGGLVVNELAPRPHNSGHHTLETAMTSQFEQHVRAICGLPLGPVNLRSPGVMVNLLGDLWAGGVPDWKLLLSEPGLFLHLYGKRAAKLGRKMGHFTLLGEGDVTRNRALHLRRTADSGSFRINIER